MERLEIGTFVIDITPPLEAGILMSSVRQEYAPFKKIRLPLKGRILVMKYSEEFFAIVSLDLLGLNHTAVSGWDRFKCSIAGSLNPDRVIITCTHTHNSTEAAGLTDLYKTDIFKQWLFSVETKIRNGITQAQKKLKAVTVHVGTSVLNRYSLQRRVWVNGNVFLSDAFQPIEAGLFKNKPIDHRVRVIRFAAENGQAVATIGLAVCHPVHEMCSASVSSDFPGEFCKSLENSKNAGMPLFINGACGDINPPTVSLGPEYARRHGEALAKKALNTQCEKVISVPVKLLCRSIPMTIREGADVIDKGNGALRLNVLCLGDIAFVFLPGEPFIKTALEIEKASPFKVTIVAGYSENYVGYIPTKKIFEEGGYETGPGRWSYLEEEAESKIQQEVKQMLTQISVKESKEIELS